MNNAFFPYFCGAVFEKKFKNPLSLFKVIFKFRNNTKFGQIKTLIVKKTPKNQKKKLYIYNKKP